MQIVAKQCYIYSPKEYINDNIKNNQLIKINLYHYITILTAFDVFLFTKTKHSTHFCEKGIPPLPGVSQTVTNHAYTRCMNGQNEDG